MVKLIASLFLSGLLMAATTASAQPFQCRPDGTQQEMNACAQRDYKQADDALNATYRQLRTKLGPTDREKLLLEQRTWLRKRDPLCKAHARPSEGGSIWPLEFYGCLTSATQARTAQLATWRP